MIERIAISKIKTNDGQIEGLPKNPRFIKDERFKAQVQSVLTFPKMLVKRPIVLSAINEPISIGGNMRLKSVEYILSLKESDFKKLCEQYNVTDENIKTWIDSRKTKSIPENWLSYCDGWTIEEKREFIIKDNVGFGEHDWDALGNDWEAEQLTDWGLEIPGWKEEAPEAEEDDYEMPEQMQVDVVLGDLIEFECEDGRVHRLLCGDSTDSDAVARLMDGEKADMVFTSPPYNGNTSVGFAGSGLSNKELYENNATDSKTANEYIQFNADIFSTIKTIAASDLVLLYNINYNKNSPDLFIDVVDKGREAFNLVETIIWEKSMAISLAGDNLTRIFEFIFVFFNGNDKPKMNKTHTNECIKNLWKISNVGANNEIHKACFPVKLAEEAINVYAKEKALLYEPFTGSGTTMVAAHQLNRICYGMELDPKYCQVIIDRMTKLDETIVVKINGKEYVKTAI